MYNVSFLIDFNLIEIITITSAPIVVLVLEELVNRLPIEFLDIAESYKMALVNV
jgi:hypothetical protein